MTLNILKMLKIFQEYVWSLTTCSKTLLKLEIIEKWNKIMFFSFTKIVKVVIDCICLFYIIVFYLWIIVLIFIINYYYLLLKINKTKENNTDVLSIVNNLTNCGVLSERILPDLVRGTLTVSGTDNQLPTLLIFHMYSQFRELACA